MEWIIFEASLSYLGCLSMVVPRHLHEAEWLASAASTPLAANAAGSFTRPNIEDFWYFLIVFVTSGSIELMVLGGIAACAPRVRSLL